MKKLIAIVLTIALFTCLFAGCSSKTTDQPATQPAADAAQTQSTSESTSSETTTSSESGEFTLYAWGDAHWNEYVQVQDLFNSLYPDYKMTYMQENSLTDLLITKAAQNALPDMFYAEPYRSSPYWAVFMQKQYLPHRWSSRILRIAVPFQAHPLDVIQSLAMYFSSCTRRTENVPSMHRPRERLFYKVV